MRTRTAFLAAAALVISACSPQPTATPARTSGAGGVATPSTSAPAATGTPSEMLVTPEPFAEVAGGPLAIAAPDDGSGRLFVASQAGQIWSVAADGSVLPDPMVDLAPFIVSGGEQGLLGLALHPDFPDDPRAFVNYTGADGDTSISSISLDPSNPDRFDVDTLTQLLFIDQPYANHNGGGVLFGPDGFLYLSLGDGGAGGDPHDNGQRTDTLLGKILRIDVDGGGDRGYAIPQGNPFADGEGMDEIYHWGLRNPWRLSFDRATGDLWIGDVGQGQWEEIDVARADAGPLNFGWVRREGAHCYGSDTCDGEFVDPVTEYAHGDLGCTVIGGYVYRGKAYPFLDGTYLFADYCSGIVFAIDSTTSSLVEPTMVGEVDGQVSAFGEDAAGELYVTTLNGTIYKVTASGS